MSDSKQEYPTTRTVKRRKEDQDCSSNCNDHSGIEMWMRGIGAMVTLCAALLSYSVIWQAPSIRQEVAKEISRLETKDRDTDYKLDGMKRDVSQLRSDVDKIKIEQGLP